MGLSRLWCTAPIPVGLDVDLWKYRTNGGREYVQNLANIPATLMRRWSIKTEVLDDDVYFSSPLFDDRLPICPEGLRLLAAIT